MCHITHTTYITLHTTLILTRWVFAHKIKYHDVGLTSSSVNAIFFECLCVCCCWSFTQLHMSIYLLNLFQVSFHFTVLTKLVRREDSFNFTNDHSSRFQINLFALHRQNSIQLEHSIFRKQNKRFDHHFRLLIVIWWFNCVHW